MAAKNLKSQKSELRASIHQDLRDAKADDLTQWSFQITDRIVGLTEYREANTLMVYFSLQEEYQTGRLIEEALAAGKRVCGPKVDWQTRTMYAAALGAPDDFETDHIGLKQPRSDDPVPPKTLDLILVPGLAFDRRGRRLGRGGGFYDRFLAGASDRTCRLAAAFDLQIVATVPADDDDQPIDLIVTPTQVLRFGTPGH